MYAIRMYATGRRGEAFVLKEDFAYLAIYLWRQSLKNINRQLSKEEARQFSSNDYYYLTTIYYLNKPNFSQIAESLGVTKPAVSLIIKKLARMGLIEKEQSRQDKRVFYIVLTEKGNRIIGGDEALYEWIDSMIRANIPSPQAYDQLEALLNKVVNKLGAEEDRE